MLVIDENKLKLLRMKEKLLEFPVDNQNEILSDYKEMVIDIDKVMYERLIDMIKNANYHNLPLEEQLKVLSELENEYNNFNEFQCRYRNIYEKYANDELQLSLIDNVYIDRIRSKISAINGYLVNNEKILDYRKNLEELNVELIESEKKKDAISARLQLLESELIDNVLKAEGRLDNHGSLEYASILEEFKKYDLDLAKLLDDTELLEQELSKASSLIPSEEEKMVAAKVCFNNMPNIETKKLYSSAYVDVLNANYKLILLRIAKLVGSKFTDYESIRDKRFKIDKLINDRSKVLIDLEIKYLVDPFDRIKLKEQMEIIELLGINLQNASVIKGKIKNTFTIVDNLQEKNNELYSIITDDLELFNDNTVVSNVIDVDDDEIQEHVFRSDEVVALKDVSDNFKLDFALDKCNAVISKVYKMINEVPVNVVTKTIVPDLVIEKDEVFDDAIDSQDIFMPSNDENIFTISDDKEVFTAPESPKLDVDSSLFEEVEPFEKIELFTNKYDDVFSQTQDLSLSQVDEMPELFMSNDNNFEKNKSDVNDEETVNDTDSELSFDEQIQVLLDDSSKVRKLVA